MGYLKSVVQSGMELADRYKMPEYVEKARQTSYYADIAVGKIDLLLCEQGSPLLTKVDEMTAAKIQATLDLASAKVEQAQSIRTEVMGVVEKKKTEVKDITKATTAKVQAKTSEALALAQQKKAKAIEKVIEKKTMAYKKAQETGTIAMKKASDVCEASTKTIEKTEAGKKVVTIMMSAKESVVSYGSRLVQKSLALPMTLQERMDKGLTYTKEQVGKSMEGAKKKGLSAYELMKAKIDTKFVPLVKSFGIDLTLYTAMYERCMTTGFIAVCKNESKALMENNVSPYLTATQGRITRKYAGAKDTFQANVVLAKTQLKTYEDKLTTWFSEFKGVKMEAATTYAAGFKSQVTKTFEGLLAMMKSKAQ